MQSNRQKRAKRRSRSLIEFLERRTLLAVTITATNQDSLLTDVDGDGRVDPGDTIQYNVVVSNSGDVDATGVTFSDVLDSQTNLGTIKVSPLAARDTYSSVGNTPLTVNAATGLRSNDIDIDGITPQNSLVVTAGTFATSAGGSVTVAADGSFTYTPQTGDQNIADTFTYTITDGDGLSSTGKATINIGDAVWYVDSAASPTGADGSFAHPFTSLAPLNNSASDADDANDTIFLYNRGVNYTGGLALEAGEKLYGDGFAFTANGMNIGVSATDSGLINSAGNAITLADGNTIDGIAIGTTSGAGMIGSGVNTLTVGSAVTISNVAGNDLDLTGGNGTVNFAAAITNTAGRSVSIVNRTGGTATLSGAISDTATGILLNNNSGATINFTGGLNLGTAANAAFTASGGGTVTVTGANNTITTTTAAALNVTNTNIGASGLTFKSISVNGATNGIILNTTGSSGGLTVTGTGTTAGSGGTIQNNVQGALFTSTSSLSLSNMNFANADSGNGTVNNIDTSAFNSGAQAAINMNGVSTATFTNLDLEGNGGTGGAQVGINGLNVSNLSIVNSKVNGFGDTVAEGDIKLFDLSGTSAITNSTFGFVSNDTTAGETLVDIRIDTGTLTLNVSGSTFQNTRASTSGSDGLQVTSTGSATFNLNVSHNTFTNLKTAGVDTFARQNSTMNVNITDGGTTGNGNTFDPGGTTVTGRAIGLNAQETAKLNFNINRNVSIKGNGGPVLEIFSIGTSTVNGRIDNNADIQNNGTTNRAGSPIDLDIEDSSTAVIDVSGNNISHLGQDAGIDAVVQGNGTNLHSSSLDVTIASNTINMTGSADFNDAILLQAGGNSTDTTTIYANVNHNGVTLGGSNSPLGLAVENTATGSNIYFQNYLGSILATWNGNSNTPSGSEAEAIDHTSGAIPAGHNGGVVKTPGNPSALLFAPGSTESSTTPANGSSATRIGRPHVNGIAQPPVVVDHGILSQAELDSLVDAAIARWDAAGISPAQDALLHQVTFSVQDLPGWYLGEATAGHVVLDTNAAGNSWFIDSTPKTDHDVPAGKIDLLTTIMHEMGHQLGLVDSYLPGDRNSLMYGYLTLGERRLPAAHEADGADPHMLDDQLGPDFLFTPINIGTLTFGTTITIRFTATLANPLVGTGSVSNQGTVSGSNFTSVLTDDPDVAGQQATVTPVQPATPSAPDLEAASDTGALSTDNITKAASPIFDVTGADSAATVELLRSGTVVASRTGSGTLTDANPPEGTFTYTVRQRFGAGGINSDASIGLSVTIDRTAPTSAGAPDLETASDTGTSSSDNVTNDNTPTFDTTTNIEAGALVELLAGSTSVASRTGAGALTASTIADGIYSFTIRQTDLAGNVSSSASFLNAQIDTLPPTIVGGSPQWNFLTGQNLAYSFSENVQTNIDKSKIVVQNLTTATTIPDANKTLAYNGSNVATLTFSTLPLPNGNYRATIAAGAVTDPAGNALAASTFDFFVLGGDANHDGKVDVTDLGVLASNWQGHGKTFSQGDFNYDGSVDVTDLGILASNWQKNNTTFAQLPNAAPMPAFQPTPTRPPTRMVSQIFGNNTSLIP